MSTSVVNRQVNIFIESGEAQRALDVLIKKETALKLELEKATNPKVVERLNLELKKLSEPIDRARKKVTGELGPSLRDLQSTVIKLGSALKRMSTNDADYTKVLAQYRQANTLLRQQKVELDAFGSAQSGLVKENPFGRVVDFAKGSLLGGAMLGVISNFSSFFSDSVSEALDAEEVSARLKSTLENLGRSDAFDRIIKKARAVAKEFQYLDNDDVVGVFNKLIDYGKLTEKEMNDLLPVIINFAAKSRISIEESASVLIKSMEGNGRALKEFGIDMKDGGTAAERLSIIMTTLKDKVDGAGAAFQETAAGGIAVAKQEFADLKEEVGDKLIPVLSGLLDKVNKIFKGLASLGPKLKNTASDIAVFFSDGFEAAKQNAENRRKAEEELVIQMAADNLNKGAADKTRENVIIEKQKTLAELRKKNELLKGQKRLLNEGASTLEDIARTELGIRVLEKKIASLQKIQDSKTNENEKLGIDGDKKEKEKEKKTTKTKSPGIDKDKQDLVEFYKFIRGKELELSTFYSSEKDKEIARTVATYEEKKKLAHGNAEALKLAEETLARELFQIHSKYAEKDLAATEKQEAEKQKRLTKLATDALTASQEFLKRFGAALYGPDLEKEAQFTLRLLRANGKEKLDLQIEQLEKEREERLKATGLTETQRLVIIEEFARREAELRKAYVVNSVNQFLEAAQQALSFLDVISDVQSQKENAELERDRKKYDKKKQNLDRQLKSGLISQVNYDRETARLQKEKEKKEHDISVKQFKRTQKLQIAQALISGALAVTSTLAAIPGPLDILSLGTARAIQLALMVATTGAQVAAIASKKPPEFGRGGRLTGPSHSQNSGMPVTDPRSGQVQAYLEGGEGIANKRAMAAGRSFSATGTPSQIISALNSYYGGVSWDRGGSIKPMWSYAKPQPMNFTRVNSAMGVRKFADGGVFGAAQAPGAAAQNTGIENALGSMMATIERLNARLDQPLVAYTLLSQHEAQQKRMEAIREASTFK